MFDRHEENERLLAGIRSWVEVESPSMDAEAVNRMVDLVQGELDAIGLETERVLGRDGFVEHLMDGRPGRQTSRGSWFSAIWILCGRWALWRHAPSGLKTGRHTARGFTI